jgi:hypothetical protein
MLLLSRPRLCQSCSAIEEEEEEEEEDLYFHKIIFV